MERGGSWRHSGPGPSREGSCPRPVLRRLWVGAGVCLPFKPHCYRQTEGRKRWENRDVRGQGRGWGPRRQGRESAGQGGITSETVWQTEGQPGRGRMAREAPRQPHLVTPGSPQDPGIGIQGVPSQGEQGSHFENLPDSPPLTSDSLGAPTALASGKTPEPRRPQESGSISLQVSPRREGPSLASRKLT